MKWKVTFKTPYVLEDAESDESSTDEDFRKFEQLAEKYLRYREYVTLVFDTDDDTVEVLRVKL
jgi:hypothetical protein